MAEEQAQKPPSKLGQPSLWAGVIGAPLVWLTQFLVAYALVPLVCHTRKFFALHLTFAIALILVATAIFICWREWQQIGRHPSDSLDGGRLGTARLASFVGLTTAALSFLLILSQAAATFFIDPCTQ
jgi:hypothetical protein